MAPVSTITNSVLQKTHLPLQAGVTPMFLSAKIIFVKHIGFKLAHVPVGLRTTRNRFRERPSLAKLGFLDQKCVFSVFLQYFGMEPRWRACSFCACFLMNAIFDFGLCFDGGSGLSWLKKPQDGVFLKELQIKLFYKIRTRITLHHSSYQ